MPRRRLLLPFIASGALFAGCYDPTFTDGKVGCTSDHQCPEGMLCVPGGETAVCFATETAPAPGAMVRVTHDLQASTLQLEITLQSFGIGKMGTPDEPRFGHYHLTFDDPKRFDSGNAYIADTDLLKVLEVKKLPGPLQGLLPGKHTIWIALANNNHTELTPKVRVESNTFVLP